MRWYCPAERPQNHFPSRESLSGGCGEGSRRRTFRRVRLSFAGSRVRRTSFCNCARRTSILVAEAFYRDHHAYTEKDIRELLDLKKRSEAGGFVTTEKDAVNLGPYLSALEPLSVVPVRMQLDDAANGLDTILRMIEERKRDA